MTLCIHRISGFATVQDAGRTGHREAGVPVSGAMDRASLARANALVGNADGAAAIEWALAGGCVRCSTNTVVAVTGAEVELARNGAVVATDAPLELAPGDELAVGRFVRGAYAYIAVRGGIDVPLVLGSRSTCLGAGFGGFEGRRLRTGDALPVGTSSGQLRQAASADRGPVNHPDQPIRVIAERDASAFSRGFGESFWASDFVVSPSSNRAGLRLERDGGGGGHESERGSAVSEPACVGAIQVPNGVGAIVLMADGPTTGGYPRIGVVASVDIPVLAQRTPGELVKFERIAVEDAHRLLRANGR